MTVSKTTIRSILNSPKKYSLFLLSHRWTLSSSYIILVLSCVYSTTLATLSQPATADQFVGTYIASNYRIGNSIVLLAQHTSFLKLPLLALQGKLPYGVVSWILLNIILVCTTCAFWTALMHKLTKKRTLAIYSNILIAAVVLASTDFSISLSMTTQRNIEYPMVLAFFYIALVKLKRPSKPWSLAAISLVVLIVASDHFFLYVLSPATILVCLLALLYNKVNFKKSLDVAIMAISGSILGVLFIYLLETFKILVLLDKSASFAYRSNNLIEYDNLPGQIQTLLHQLLKLFGGDFFGKPISISTLFIFPFTLLLIVSLYSANKMFKNSRNPTDPENLTYIYLITFSLIAIAGYLLNSLATKGDANIRFLSILPLVGVALTAGLITSRKFTNYSWIYFILCLLVLISGAVRSLPNRRTYSQKKHEFDSWIILDKSIILTLKQKNISLVFGSIGYSATTWFYSAKKIDSYSIIPCNLTSPPLSNTGWYVPRGLEKTALIIDRSVPSYAKGETWADCPDSEIRRIYGTETERVTVGKSTERSAELWIYNYDIRSRMVPH